MVHDQQPLLKVRHAPGVPGEGLALACRGSMTLKLRRSLCSPQKPRIPVLFLFISHPAAM